MDYNIESTKEWAIRKGRVTKKDVCVHLGIKCNASGERQARRVLADIAAECPVISLSSEEGYEVIPKAKTDLDKYRLRRQMQENVSRAREILKRNRPIRKALEED